MAPEVLDAVREVLVREGGEITPQRVARALRDRGRPVGDATVLAVHEALCRDALGAGPLEPLLRLDGVTDVLVNGAREVYLDRGHGLERVDEVRFTDEDAVRRLAQRLAASAGRRLDDASPYADLRLPDGTRFHAVLAPLARPGTVLSLRVPQRRALDLAGVVDSGMVTPDGAVLVRRLLERRCAFLVTGGTGTGKTTLLAALLGLVPPGERVVIVEDSSELRPTHPHVVALECRPANLEGAGAIELRTLVRQALRMRPDRLVVGEVRGAEIIDLLAAMNTGHEGGCGTLHANSATAVPARVEALALAAGLGREAAHSQLASAVEVVLHLVRDGGGRRLSEIAVPVREDDGLVRLEACVRFDADGGATEGPAVDALVARLT